MVYTLTLNPALDYHIYIDEIKRGYVNRAARSELSFGGKGINVSVVLSRLGVDTNALGFAAGFTGDELIKRLLENGINADFIRLSKGETRINVKLHEGVDTDINMSSPVANDVEIKALFARLDRLSSGDILCLSGSEIKGVSYDEIMSRLSKSTVKFVLDAEGQALIDGVKHKPFLVKPNHIELGQIFSVQINSLEQAAEYAAKLHNLGAENVLVSMAEKGAVLVDSKGEAYYCEAPRGELVSSVGAGDSTVAGFIAGEIRGLSSAKKLALAVAAGSATAFSKTLADTREIEVLLEKINAQKMA